MSNRIDEKVSVSLVSDHITGKAIPKYLKWKNTVYNITTVGLHYIQKKGVVLTHWFSVTDTSRCFLLSFNTQNLQWRLEEVTDATSV